MQRHSQKKIIRAWCLYDWANSAFATTIMAAVLPIFFQSVSTVSIGRPVLATSLWGATSAVSMLIVAVLSLILGPYADAAGSRKRLLAVFMSIGSLATASLASASSGSAIARVSVLPIRKIGMTV